ncbi:SDR family NAD(P)-dependent oxidoreductase [Puia dinghuensis]|uniref:Short-chain dehydrogenase/reductase n=1 Tax=Puia dinghuensis TaxID=1792502 RepID=A0A8J2U652_9BACT|nr:SDR family NAD(P)-dependent oxidoreductase [Puia dinghuensis]GGA81501.1 short-chain dehydrogenase/reductase [Puia dinghuensis]
MEKKVWYVTGASKGLGLALVRKLVAEGHQVAATSRSLEALEEAVGPAPADQFLPLEVDLSDEASVAGSLLTAHEVFGRIDVVVNNAGYGIGGAIEELTLEEIRHNFDVNVFAPIIVIQKVMPYLRAQRSGHIINIASIAGFAGVIGWSVYAAAKQAVIGLSDVLAQDVRSLGIHVTAVAPGAFRTQFLSKESVVFTGTPIDDYREVRASHARYQSIDGKQIGDPVKAAEALITLASTPEPPTLLFLGSDAYNRATAKMAELSQLIEKWKCLTLSTQLEEFV